MSFFPPLSILQGSMLCASSSQRKHGRLEARCFHNVKLVWNVTDISVPGAVKDACSSAKGSSHQWRPRQRFANKPPGEFVWNLHHLESLVRKKNRRPMLELRISSACKAALPEASSAVTPSMPKATLQCRYAYLVWGSSENFLAEICSWNMYILGVYVLTFCIFCQTSGAVCGSQTVARLPSWQTRGVSTRKFYSIPNTCRVEVNQIDRCIAQEPTEKS